VLRRGGALLRLLLRMCCIVALCCRWCVAADELIDIMVSVGLDMSASDDMEYVAVAL
jgi:hypothetical protein